MAHTFKDDQELDIQVRNISQTFRKHGFLCTQHKFVLITKYSRPPVILKSHIQFLHTKPNSLVKIVVFLHVIHSL